MSDEELDRIAALADAGQAIDSASARALVDEVRRVRAGLMVAIRPILARDVDPSQAWFWTPEWQAGEHEVDEHIAAGRLETFDDADALFAYLDRER